MKDKDKQKAWHSDLPWAVRNDYAQEAMKKRNRDRQGIKDPPEPSIIPALVTIKKFIKF